MAVQSTLSRYAFPWGTALQSLGLALMAGGMLALGAFTAPVVFGQFSREAAAPVMAIIFRRYDIVLQVALGLVLLGEGLRFASKQLTDKGFLPVTRLVLMGGLTLSLLYATVFLNADIERMNRAGLHRDYTTAVGRQFEVIHKRSEGLYKLNLLIVILLILITPFVGGKTVSRQEAA